MKVTLLTRGAISAQSRNIHVHSVSTKTLDDFSSLSGRIVRGFDIGDALSVSPQTPVERLTPRPVFDLGFVHKELADQADALGLIRRVITSVQSELTCVGRTWALKGACQRIGTTANILVDASGASRSLCDLLEHWEARPIFVDEGGSASFYKTFVGDGRINSNPLTVVFQVPTADGSETIEGLIAFHKNGQTHVTLKADVSPKQSIQSVMAALSATAPAQLPTHALERLTDTKWTKGSTGYTSFGARRLALEEADLDHLPPCFAIGDALIQTPPSQGQGLAQLAAQLGIIETALAGGKGLSTIKQDLAAAAHAAWLSSIMRATAQDVRPAPQTLATPVPLEGASSL
jgi:hypothetical protein